MSPVWIAGGVLFITLMGGALGITLGVILLVLGLLIWYAE